MSSYEYEDYVRDQRRQIESQQQAVLVTEAQIHEQKQEELRQIVYDELLKKYHVLQKELEDAQQSIKDREDIIMDKIEQVETFERDRIVEIPYERVRLMFLLEEHPTSIFMCFNKEDKLKWVKAPHEMRDQRIP